MRDVKISCYLINNVTVKREYENEQNIQIRVYQEH